MAEDDDACSRFIVIGIEGASQDWVHSQEGKQIGGNHRPLHIRGISAVVRHREARAVVSRQAIEDLVLRADIGKVRERKGRLAVGLLGRRPKPRRSRPAEDKEAAAAKRR